MADSYLSLDLLAQNMKSLKYAYNVLGLLGQTFAALSLCRHSNSFQATSAHNVGASSMLPTS